MPLSYGDKMTKQAGRTSNIRYCGEKWKTSGKLHVCSSTQDTRQLRLPLSIWCHFWRNINISCEANSFLPFYFARWILRWLEFVKLPHQRLQLCLSLLRISHLKDSVSDRKGAATDRWCWRSSLTSRMVSSLSKTNTPLVLGVSPQTRVEK